MSPRPLRYPWIAAPIAIAFAALALPNVASAADAAASGTVTGGGLNFINGSPSAVAFPSVMLNGSDQTTSKTQTLDLSDARGSGAGWNITATSTAFTNGSVALPNDSTTMTGIPTVACDAVNSCVTPTNTITTYALPAATVAPLATKMYNAALNTGMGSLTVTPTWRLKIPATAAIGTYTSTWTLSLVSGP